MKKLISLFTTLCIILSMFGVFTVFADTVPTAEPDDTSRGIVVTKTLDDYYDDFLRTDCPVRLKAAFNSYASPNKNFANKNEFVKEAWLRVDLLDADADLWQVYSENKDKERVINPRTYGNNGIYQEYWHSAQKRDVVTFEMDVTINGTYLFCGWVSDSESPEYIERANVTEAEIERPIPYVTAVESDGEYTGIITVKDIECGKDKSLKKYTLTGHKVAPPGSFYKYPYNEQYDEMTEDECQYYVSNGLLVGSKEYADGEPFKEAQYTVNKAGTYCLFAVDSDGKYSYTHLVIKDSPKPTATPTATPKPTVKPTAVPTISPIPTPSIPPVEVIVAPPTANVESGIVPYGTKVTLTPSGAHVAYSINDGGFKYEYSDVTLTIKEDTVVTIKSWVDCLAPNTSYLIGEATYTYTVDKETIPIYPYQITGLRFTDTSGNEIILPEQNKSFIVEADMIKTEERDEKDYLFVAVYDESGALMSIDYVKAKFAVDGEYSFGFNVPAQEKKVGSVKAFVWNTFNSMRPLAQLKTLAPDVFE